MILFFLKKLVKAEYLPAALLFLFCVPAFSQVKCKGPSYCAVKEFNFQELTVICNTVPGVYAYRARVKKTDDTIWNYFMVNAPDTIIKIPKLKTNFDYIVQMGTMCSSSINDTSGFSQTDTAFHFCACANTGKMWMAEIDSTSATVKWLPTFDAKKFKVFYSTAKKNKGVWNTTSVIATNDPEVQLTNLLPGTDYEISIRAICEDRNRGNSELFLPYLKFKTK